MSKIEIFKLFGSVFIDNDKANQSLDSTDQKAGGVGATLGKMGGFALKAGVAVGAAAIAGGTAMFALANKTAEAADVIDKLSERTGINREELQRWQYAAGQSGADVGKLEVGIKKLSDQMDGAVHGNEAAAEAFAKIGISMDDLKNKSQEEIFSTVMAELADMEQGAARNALGNDLLGKSYTEMLPLLNAGSKGMSDLKQRADELGIVMSEEAVMANVKFGDSLSDVKQAFGGVFMRLSNDFLPVLNRFLDWVLGHMPEIQATIQTVFGVVDTVVTKVFNVFDQNILPILKVLFAWIKENMPAIKTGFMDVFNPVADIVSRLWHIFADNLLPAFKDLYDFVKPTFPVIGAIIKTAFDVVIKVVDGVISVFETLTGWIKTAIDWIQKFNGTSVKDKNVSVSTTSFRRVPPGLAEGGTTLTSGRVLVGENAPEILDLPAGARVTPLNKLPSGGITININGANIMDDYGVDRMMDRIIDRLALQGVR